MRVEKSDEEICVLGVDLLGLASTGPQNRPSALGAEPTSDSPPGRESQDRPGDQGGDDDGRGRVQVPGGLQELPHQEHEAQPDCSG